MVPPYRADQCNHIYLYGEVLPGSIVMPLVGASNEGRSWACATLIRWADISLVCPLLLLYPGCPRLGPFMFVHDGGRWCLW